MKAIKILVLIPLFFMVTFIKGQSSQIHPTISSLKVLYKSVPQASVNNGPSSIPEIQVIPQCTISLVVGANVVKVYFKILNTQTNEVIYDVNYPINSSLILNTEGKKLFENVNGVLFISKGTSIPLKPYTYQIQTENSQNTLSVIYSAKH